MKSSKAIFSVLIFGLAFLYTPIVFLIVGSFSESDVSGTWLGFSLKWFSAVFNDRDLILASITSFKIAAISATVACVLGVVMAVIVTSQEPMRGKTFLCRTVVIPVVIPEIIIGFSLLMLFMAIEDIIGYPVRRGVTTISIGHVMASMAYVYMTVKSQLESCDSSMTDAALNLGAWPFTIFFKIKLPIIAKSVVTGWLLTFTLSIDDLVIASFLTGPGVTTLPILIFSNIRVGITPAVNAFSTMFILLIVLCMTLSHLIAEKTDEKKWT
jgi:putrescine transport system permease protein